LERRRHTTGISASGSNLLDTVAYGVRYYIVTNAPQTGSFLQLKITKTNSSVVTVSVTNAPGNTNTSTLIRTLVDGQHQCQSGRRGWVVG
jgi:hypothetical protein